MTRAETRRLKERLIDDLERRLFPHQESEEEQESFTPEGRKRVAQWLDEVIPAASIDLRSRA